MDGRHSHDSGRKTDRQPGGTCQRRSTHQPSVCFRRHGELDGDRAARVTILQSGTRAPSDGCRENPTESHALTLSGLVFGKSYHQHGDILTAARSVARPHAALITVCRPRTPKTRRSVPAESAPAQMFLPPGYAVGPMPGQCSTTRAVLGVNTVMGLRYGGMRELGLGRGHLDHRLSRGSV